MQLLFEEFFRKIFKRINQLNIFFRIGIKFSFFVLIILILAFLARQIYLKNYQLLIAVFIILAVAELAHVIRKSREKMIMKDIAEENQIKESTKDLLEMKRTKKTQLLGVSKVKNHGLLSKNKTGKKEAENELLRNKKIMAEPVKKDFLNKEFKR
jgi:hypothetical protein